MVCAAYAAGGMIASTVAYEITAWRAQALIEGFTILGYPPEWYWTRLYWPWPAAGAAAGVAVGLLVLRARGRKQR
jgi:hypothetical protein